MADFKGDTIEKLIDMVMIMPERETIRHALEFAHADGKMESIRELAQQWVKNTRNPNPFAEHGISVEAYNDHIFGRRD